MVSLQTHRTAFRLILTKGTKAFKTVPFAMLCALLLLSTAWGGPRPAFTPTVVVQPARLKEVNPPARYVGHVEAIQEVEIMPRVEGYLTKVGFKEGQYVHQGDLLYTIEQPPYLAKVRLWEARVAQAKAALYKAEMRLKRLKAASPQSVPATEMDDAIAQERMAQAQLKEAQAQLELAKIDLGYTEIKAPISGLLGKSFFTKGNLVGPGKGPLALLVQIEPIRVVYSISDSELIELQRRMERNAQKGSFLEVEIELPNGELYPEKGELEFVNNQVDPSTGTISVRAVFNNKDHLLLPGEYVNVLVRQRNPEKRVVVPQSAVLTDAKGHYLLVVGKGQVVKQVRVKLGKQIGTGWIVESGLSPDALVVVEGIQKVRPGQKVKAVVKPGGAR